MNTDPEARYQDPGQLLADLITIASQMGLRSVPAEGIVWRRIPVRRTREIASTAFVSSTVIAICIAALVMHFSPSGLDKTEAETQRILSAMLPTEEVSPRSENSNTQSTQSGVDKIKTAPDELETTEIVADGVPDPRNGGALVSKGNDDTGEIGDSSTNVSEIVNTAAPPPFRVQSASGQERLASTLAQAWSDVEPGDVIILDFDGVRGIPTRCLTPIYRESHIITIRAEEGRSPVLEFQGEGMEAADVSSTPGRLFQLSNNLNLKLVGVHLRVTVRPEVRSNEWVLFEFNGANRVELQDCTIEVLNPAAIKTSVFRLSDSRTGTTDQEQFSIRLEHCAVRGGCDLVRVAGHANGKVSAEQSFFALDGSLVDNIGSDAMVLQGSLEVDLNHTTNICSKAMFRMADSDSLGGAEP